MRPTDGMDEIRVTAPTPGSCPICAAKHERSEPHDRDSLYYKNWFYKRHKRFPTWEDAMSHCDEVVKADFRKHLEKRGVPLKEADGE